MLILSIAVFCYEGNVSMDTGILVLSLIPAMIIQGIWNPHGTWETQLFISFCYFINIQDSECRHQYRSVWLHSQPLFFCPHWAISAFKIPFLFLAARILLHFGFSSSVLSAVLREESNKQCSVSFMLEFQTLVSHSLSLQRVSNTWTRQDYRSSSSYPYPF